MILTGKTHPQISMESMESMDMDIWVVGKLNQLITADSSIKNKIK